MYGRYLCENENADKNGNQDKEATDPGKEPNVSVTSSVQEFRKGDEGNVVNDVPIEYTDKQEIPPEDEIDRDVVYPDIYICKDHTEVPYDQVRKTQAL